MKLILLTLICLSSFVESSDKALRAKFENGSWNFQSGIFVFEKNNQTVTFVSAVHIAPQRYYDQINKLLKTMMLSFMKKLQAIRKL